MQTAPMRRVLSVIFLCFGILFCVCFAESIRTEMIAAIERCFTVIIPSLYAMMILSQMLVSTNTWLILARPFRRISKKIFGLPEGCFALLLLSQFAGYPIGAGMLRTLSENGNLSQKDAARLLCVCYGGGPAFLLGLLGASDNRGKFFTVLFLSQLFSNLLLALFLFRRHPITLRTQVHTVTPVSASVLVESTANAGKSLLQLCGIILAFSGICAILEALHFFSLFENLARQLSLSFPIRPILQSILEVTHTADLSLPLSIRLPLLAGLLSFGGICVLLQVRAAAGTVFSGKIFIPCRILTGCSTALFCHMGLCLFFPQGIPNDTITVMTSSTYQVQHNPYFPVCMLLCMMLLLLHGLPHT